MREIANRQRSAADRGAPGIRVVGGQDRGACEHIDSTATTDRGCKHIIGGCVIEVDRAGSSAKCDARRSERAGGSRGIARARADVECSRRTGVRRDRNARRDDIAAVSAIVSVPVPEYRILMAAMSLQREPAPVTVTAPCEPRALPILVTRGVISTTRPPFAIVSVPVPKLPILSPRLVVRCPAGARASDYHRAG